jgi:hypothetical protein
MIARKTKIISVFEQRLKINLKILSLPLYCLELNQLSEQLV